MAVTPTNARERFRGLLRSHNPRRPALLFLLLGSKSVENLLEGDLAQRVLFHVQLGDAILFKGKHRIKN